MAARSYRDDAVVLRTRVFSEADRVLTLLTKHHGLVQALAKGVRRTSSRFGARLEPFMVVDVQCQVGRTFHYVTQAELKSAYGDPLAADYDYYTAAATVAEVTERLIPQADEPVLPLYQLAVGAFAACARRKYPHRLIVDAFLLRAVATAGWAMSCDDCAACGAAGPHGGFNVAQGGAVCAGCRGPGTARVSPKVLVLMGALLSGDWASAVAADPVTCRSVSGLVAAYTQWHIESGVRSLAILE